MTRVPAARLATVSCGPDSPSRIPLLASRENLIGVSVCSGFDAVLMADYFRQAGSDKVDSATGGGTEDCEAG